MEPWNGCCGVWSRTCTARAPTTLSTPSPSAPWCWLTAAVRQSSAIRRIITRTISWPESDSRARRADRLLGLRLRGYDSTNDLINDRRLHVTSAHCPARRARRHRACGPRGGRAAATLADGTHRL